MIRGKINPWKYFKTIFSGKKTNALFAKKDLKPGFAYFLQLFNFLMHR
jgi:hypothetical protein